MNLILRPEEPRDHRAVEALTREAFWNVYRPGCAEHYLLHILRDSKGYLPGLHIVAEDDGNIVGSIVYSRSKIKRQKEASLDTLSFGPLSVHPARQGQGIGSLLVRRTLAMAADMGEWAVIITGSPGYYARFGFSSATGFGITLPDASSPPYLMALELRPRALAGIGGVFYEDEAFDRLDMQSVADFDRRFPPREKLVLPGQLE